MKNLEKKLNAGETIELLSGQWKIGVDIPEGEYKVTVMNMNYATIYIWDENGNLTKEFFATSYSMDIQLKNGSKIKTYAQIKIKKISK